jgi:Protein of unknown function (DUF3800)
MMNAYMDESGIQESARNCIVAGYIGSAAHWKKFNPAWEAILRKYGIREFHAQRFFAKDNRSGRRVGDYRGWDDRKANEFLQSLIEVIKSYKIRALASFIPVELFQSQTEHSRRFLTGGRYNNGKWVRTGAPNKPYYLPFQHCLIEATERCPVSDKVHFVFDENKQLSPWAKELYWDLVDSGELQVGPMLGDIAFESSLDHCGLQAADLFCYEVNQALKEHDTIAKGGPESKRLTPLMHWHGHIRGFSAGIIELVLEGCPPEV